MEERKLILSEIYKDDINRVIRDIDDLKILRLIYSFAVAGRKEQEINKKPPA